MNKIIKKSWKDAATLIIAGRNKPACLSQKHIDGTTAKKPSEVQDGPTQNENANFDILLLKRDPESRFMPNAYVFPGGVVDESDYSEKWNDVFKSAGFIDEQMKIYQEEPKERPPLFDNYRGKPISPDVAFRICALREAFEESGVLIAKSKDEEMFSGLSHEENMFWRTKVHNNASLFMDLCKKFNIVPDIWSLTEWSNWLTPVSMSRRYDTIFYLCFLEYQPRIEQDDKEVVHAQWNQPYNMLQDHLDQKLWVAPPQAYELTRLARFKTLNELSTFAKMREKHGTEKWLPFRYLCNDCLLSVLPGDDAFPPNPEEIVKNENKATKYEVRIDKSLKEFNKNIQHFNRLEMFSSNHYNIISNCTRLGHPPLNYQIHGNVVEEDVSSKL
eukprot:gene15944-17547_t